MDTRQRQDLDNYITGHYGEDQFQGEDLPDTAHAEYVAATRALDVYEYDPTDDGPETAIRFVLVSHSPEELQAERSETVKRLFERITSRYHV